MTLESLYSQLTLRKLAHLILVRYVVQKITVFIAAVFTSVVLREDDLMNCLVRVIKCVHFDKNCLGMKILTSVCKEIGVFWIGREDKKSDGEFRAYGFIHKTSTIATTDFILIEGHLRRACASYASMEPENAVDGTDTQPMTLRAEYSK